MDYFEAIKLFYTADARRARSPERDYGVHWGDGKTPQRYRVSYIMDTGEIYAVGDYTPVAPVEVLGVIQPDSLPAGRKLICYETLEHILGEWAEHCDQDQDGLSWVRDRLRCPYETKAIGSLVNIWEPCTAQRAVDMARKFEFVLPGPGEVTRSPYCFYRLRAPEGEADG